MKHSFEFRDWVDFVRGVASPEHAAAMAEQLAAGAPESTRLHALADALLAGMRWQRDIEVPAPVTRRAAALFAGTRERAPTGLAGLLATLVLDSFATPQLAGARSGAAAVRHTTHRAGEFELGLRFERLPGSERVSVIGHLMSGVADAPLVAAFPVVALRRDRIVAHTVSTDRGEFQLELPASGASRLVLGLGDSGRRIEVDLAALDKRRAKGKTARAEGSAPQAVPATRKKKD